MEICLAESGSAPLDPRKIDPHGYLCTTSLVLCSVAAVSGQRKLVCWLLKVENPPAYSIAKSLPSSWTHYLPWGVSGSKYNTFFSHLIFCLSGMAGVGR